jgi:hypothetical protein
MNSGVHEPTDLSRIQKLARQAEETIWDGLPLCAIAEAHRKKAEGLMARGSPESGISEVYVEYLKYLRLYPHKDSPVYVSVSSNSTKLSASLT